MDFHEIKEALFTAINENDPYRASKQLQVKNWCYAFLTCFSTDGEIRIPFFIDVVSDKDCWEESDSIHRVKLNRRTAARKMIQPESWTGRTNPLGYIECYLIACKCCLEEDIAAFFERLKEIFEIRDDNNNKTEVLKLIRFLSKDKLTDPLTEYWSHIMGGLVSHLKLEGRNLYEHGLNLSLHTYTGYVEAVEFFWVKIKLLPDEELNKQQKFEILMKAAVRAAGTNLRRYPEIFEFCVGQISSDNYPELLKRDFAENYEFGSLAALQANLCFDQFQKLFDCLKPNNISANRYYKWLTCLEVEEYSKHYTNEAVKLFMCMWRKEELNKHRKVVLKKEMIDSIHRGSILVPFVKKNCMEPVWAILDECCQDHVGFFNSEKAIYIRSVLQKREDYTSLLKFLSYKYLVCGMTNRRVNQTRTDSDKKHVTKRLKTD